MRVPAGLTLLVPFARQRILSSSSARRVRVKLAINEGRKETLTERKGAGGGGRGGGEELSRRILVSGRCARARRLNRFTAQPEGELSQKLTARPVHRHSPLAPLSPDCITTSLQPSSLNRISEDRDVFRVEWKTFRFFFFFFFLFESLKDVAKMDPR